MIPVLVGINASVAFYALRNRPAGAGTRWFGALGAFVGLFTACPTCAGFFLASLLGGFGATTLALGLAPFQALFIAIALPALVIAPVLTARNMKSFIYSSCKVPERPQTRRQPTGTS
jgi:MFS family permease